MVTCKIKCKYLDKMHNNNNNNNYTYIIDLQYNFFTNNYINARIKVKRLTQILLNAKIKCKYKFKKKRVRNRKRTSKMKMEKKKIKMRTIQKRKSSPKFSSSSTRVCVRLYVLQVQLPKVFGIYDKTSKNFYI